jgi:hypothetical protein
MLRYIIDNAKNILGWQTKRKIVVFAVDDYGNVRLSSAVARDKMNKAGLTIHNRFDAFDALENREDLEALFDVLESVRDSRGKPAIFTPFALCCNINFAKMKQTGYTHFIPELLPETFAKLSAEDALNYEGTWSLWKHGIEKGLLLPQFHGREHFNLKVFEEKLLKRDEELMINLENNSYTSISNSGYPTISYTAAFEFDNFEENERLRLIIEDGLNLFEKVYGYKSTHFNSPGGRENSILHKTLTEQGVKFIDAPFIKKEHQGNGKFKSTINYTGKVNSFKQLFFVRNVVFEPTNTNVNHVARAMKQIELAFRWNKPAIISSHRVNFCGQISSDNRTKGLRELKLLLTAIVKRWPDVEFMSSDELGDLIIKETVV